MNLMSALLRVVGKPWAESSNEAWWLSISYATGARRVYRHRDSRFVYPPSSRHVHFAAAPSANRQHRETIREDAKGVDRLMQAR